MKRFLLCLIVLVGLISKAQTDVVLRINHKLGIADFAYNQVAQNNLGQEFKATRLEYYLSQITIVHDGGIETAVPLDTLALVRPGTEISTSIELGNYTFTTIELVKFYIGVQQPTNNEDPSAYSVLHPLGPKSPSMHWGWTAGYRFVAYEGVAGAGFSQTFELHGLGNENYFQVESVVDLVNEGGVIVMNINADYVRGVENIDLSAGAIFHGTTGLAKQTLENWRDFVFGSYLLGVEKENLVTNWSVYPNPSVGRVTILVGETTEASSLIITNALGELIENINIEGILIKEIELKQSGLFLFTIYNQSGVAIETKRIVIR